MKWKRSRKAKEQATASAQSDAEQLRSGGKTSTEKSEENRRTVNTDKGLELDLEDGEEEEEEEDDDSQHAFPVGMPRSTDFVKRGTDAGYSPHSTFSDDDLEGMQVADRKIGAGL